MRLLSLILIGLGSLMLLRMAVAYFYARQLATAEGPAYHDTYYVVFHFDWRTVLFIVLTMLFLFTGFWLRRKSRED